ncbi:MAG TPA: redoxin domain-containing protein [Elusimicrobiota bacterium]|nr:redoxin domain-containing protein [Elusimicrobiota bacterium]
MKSLRAVKRLFFLLVLAQLALGCREGASKTISPEPTAQGADPNAPAAPDFTLQTLDGKTASLSDFRGRPVFLDFWATWCPPCRLSIPLVKKIHQDYSDKGLQVLGVSLDEDTETVAPFARNYSINYMVLLGGNSPIQSVYQVRGVPTFFLLNSKGQVVRRWEGFDPRLEPHWRMEIENLLSQPK